MTATKMTTTTALTNVDMPFAATEPAEIRSTKQVNPMKSATSHKTIHGSIVPGLSLSYPTSESSLRAKASPVT